MKDLMQKIALILITSLIGLLLQFVVGIRSDIAVLSNEVANTTVAVNKMSLRLDKFDERIRRNEIHQAQKQTYIAAN